MLPLYNTTSPAISKVIEARVSTCKIKLQYRGMILVIMWVFNNNGVLIGCIKRKHDWWMFHLKMLLIQVLVGLGFFSLASCNNFPSLLTTNATLGM